MNGRKSLDRLETSLVNLRSFFGRTRVLDITTDRVKAYIANRKDEGRANSTIRNEVNALRRAMKLAHQAGHLSTVPHIPVPRVTAVRRGFVEEGDLRALLAELPAHLRAPTLFAYLTGWRKAEVLGLTWDQVDFVGGVVRLEPGTTKNDEGREFPFRVLPDLADLLDAQREHTRAVERERGDIVPWVFHRRGKGLQDPRKSWHAACEKVGLSGLLFHDLRRSAVRNLERAGVPRSTAMRLTGHKTESVYRRYAIVDQKMTEEGVEKLARLRANASSERQVIPITGGANG